MSKLKAYRKAFGAHHDMDIVGLFEEMDHLISFDDYPSTHMMCI